ncbi:Uncharacterized protein MCHI_003849, partial [Candidatus Magnetoovum chiemensis]
MLVGIMSDTHDNMDNLRKAVRIFNNSKVSIALHAGDFTSGFTFRVLKDLDAEFIGIFGNNDGDVFFLSKMSSNRIYKQPYQLIIEDKKIIMIHEHHLVEPLCASSRYDILIYGHTHTAKIEKINNTLTINPGECCGWLHENPSIALTATVVIKNM